MVIRRLGASGLLSVVMALGWMGPRIVAQPAQAWGYIINGFGAVQQQPGESLDQYFARLNSDQDPLSRQIRRRAFKGNSAENPSCALIGLGIATSTSCVTNLAIKDGECSRHPLSSTPAFLNGVLTFAFLFL
jgi:hypothetical protein